MKYLWSSRLLASVLILGGGIGALLSVLAIGTLLPQDAAAAAKAIGVGLLYASASAIGISLWRQRAFGRRWAPVVFALQIPVLSLPALSYDWYTGAAFTYSIGPGVNRWSTQIGAADHFSLASNSAPIVGVNLVALLAVAYLLALRPNNSSKPTPLRGAA